PGSQTPGTGAAPPGGSRRANTLGPAALRAAHRHYPASLAEWSTRSCAGAAARKTGCGLTLCSTKGPLWGASLTHGWGLTDVTLVEAVDISTPQCGQLEAPGDQTMRTLIIIPAYNEAENIGAVIGEVRSLYPSTDLLVVDDGSSDTTAVLAERAGAK